ncbi:DUF5681 domain-containing protein [Bradyrhizobium mercantei]|uniref:DUF5681 domain-containing protein n=1 Tax=Bradyrhizobium mercantei TaxID=1904807 RepID=UPI0011780161|nr:DUF5681 domain-containing protein [Bradyrhizobium mercantei]
MYTKAKVLQNPSLCFQTIFKNKIRTRIFGGFMVPLFELLSGVNSGKTSTDRRPDGMPVGRPFEKGESGNPAGRPKGSIDIMHRVHAPTGGGQGSCFDLIGASSPHERSDMRD